ncbi:Oligouridylate-binding protein 1B [Vitis vinifera]|uniref:Oligouridylate-binding protein 1B n=1 Tax=Vitis vinifera TaxID=29760 RepID=A0A438K7G9_VITVI|nr:Oligouridylate-binding protein 1B [Vitis vinifera]
MQHQRLKQQQQALMQQALLQQQSLYHPGLLAPPQIEPIPSGNLPPGFDSSTCRSVYIGNIHTQVSEPLLQEVFASTGPVEGCKLVRKEKSSYGFIHYFDRRSAALAILSLNGRHLFGQPIKVNWAYASGQREDTSGHFNIFVGDLSPEVTDATLFACFSVFPSCSDARVMWDQKTGRSRGFGFVSFRNQQDAQSAINDITGKWLGSRQIRCNWATKGAGSNDDKQSSDAKSVVELTNGSSGSVLVGISEDGKETATNEAPDNNPQYTTVYVGNLAPEVTQLDLHRHFHTFGAGWEIPSQFCVANQSSGQMLAAQLCLHDMSRMVVCGFKSLKVVDTGSVVVCSRPISYDSHSIETWCDNLCSWGSKPTPPGTSSNPLPPPAAAPLPGQHPLKQAAMGMGAAGASQAIYDGGFQNVAAAQQLMYYQKLSDVFPFVQWCEAVTHPFICLPFMAEERKGDMGNELVERPINSHLTGLLYGQLRELSLNAGSELKLDAGRDF